MVIFDYYNVLFDKKNGFYPYVYATIKSLSRKHKIAILSAEKLPNIKEELKTKKLDDLFTKIITNAKESDYLNLTKEFGIVPKDFIIVDSNSKRGIKIANKIGAKSIWLNLEDKSPPDDAAFFPTHFASSLEEIIQIID